MWIYLMWVQTLCPTTDAYIALVMDVLDLLEPDEAYGLDQGLELIADAYPDVVPLHVIWAGGRLEDMLIRVSCAPVLIERLRTWADSPSSGGVKVLIYTLNLES